MLYIYRCHRDTQVKVEMSKQFMRYGTRQDVKYRALAQIGKRKYNLVFQNCEHFAKWCAYGDKISRQIEWLCLGSSWIVLMVMIAGAVFFLYGPTEAYNKLGGWFGAVVYFAVIVTVAALASAIFVRYIAEKNKCVHLKQILETCNKNVDITHYCYTVYTYEEAKNTYQCSWLVIYFGCALLLLSNAFMFFYYPGQTVSKWY